MEKIIAVHSQSNRPGTPLAFEGQPEEQAYDSRALCLPGTKVLALTSALELEYADYFTNTLKLKLPNIVVPKNRGISLSDSILHDNEAVNAIKELTSDGKRYTLSVFDPTNKEAALLEKLINIGIDVTPELNFSQASELGNKASFRKFCGTYDLPQIKGGVFDCVEDVFQFVTSNSSENERVVVKHPTGTAGEGISIVSAADLENQIYSKTWTSWLSQAGRVVAELFHAKGGEHALHININSEETYISGLYDQLVYKNDEGVLSHYGCKYPLADAEIKEDLIDLAQTKIIPVLQKLGYTGPACFDVLSNPYHLMELNTRAGANMYAHKMVDRVAESVYGVKEGLTPFMFLTNIEYDPNFSELTKHSGFIQPTEDGMVIFTNPGRHEFGKYDMVAMSTNSKVSPEDILFKALVDMLGQNAAVESFNKIYNK